MKAATQLTRRVLPKVSVVVMAAVFSGSLRADQPAAQAASIQLSDKHVAAVNRPRRIMVNNDVGYPLKSFEVAPDQWIAARFSLFDEPGSQVDCISWCLDEGNYACYPSRVLPEVRYPGLQKWLDAGVDIVKVMVDETHKRGLEAFWEYRLNGADRTEDLETAAQLPMKQSHPDWLLKRGWWSGGLWNFAVPELRTYKVKILREVAENYDFDGLTVDFGRHPPALPIGEQWRHHETLTDFVRQLRLTLQGVAGQRGRPLLLAVRVPASPAGCHYDGLDIETWADQNLVDIIIMGVRSTRVDVHAFRRITAAAHIKLYPSIDDGHSTDGYRHAPIEFFRGLASNWWHQGVDGIVTFNFANESPALAPTIGQQAFAPHQQSYHEIGAPETLRFKNKMFVLQRRYGGGWGTSWDFYQNMNHEAPLPVVLLPNGDPVLESLYIGDDVARFSHRVVNAELRVLIKHMLDGDTAEAKFNGILLPPPTVQDGGWRVFTLSPDCFALGPNLVGARLIRKNPQSKQRVSIEKLEVHVFYKESTDK